MSFKELNLIEPLLKALQDEGYTDPTPIQTQAIPHILNNKDVLGCAQTGTGKTAAFALPVLQNLKSKTTTPGIKALVLTPTRELAIQISESFEAYGKYLKLKHIVIYGGVSQLHQTNALRKGVDIVVATPGRLLDLINQGFINLNKLETLVLDEADRMLDMGFINDIKKIISRTPQSRQTTFFSATMPKEVQSLVDEILRNPVNISVSPISSAAETIKQSVYFVEKPNKKELLHHLIKQQDIDTVLVFTKTKHGADKVALDLNKKGIKAEAIHGDKSQTSRQRALSNFKNKSTRVLVATDIAARGIDVDDLSFVINYDLPNLPETYIHRIGRTGRAGANGVALSFCDTEERSYLKDINKLPNLKISIVKEHPYESTYEAVEKIEIKPSSSSKFKERGKTSSNTNRPKRKWSKNRA